MAVIVTRLDIVPFHRPFYRPVVGTSLDSPRPLVRPPTTQLSVEGTVDGRDAPFSRRLVLYGIQFATTKETRFRP